MYLQSRRQPGAAALFLSCILAAYLTGCGGAIDPGPFNRFAESTAELRDSADEVLGLQYDWARERFLQETAAGDSVSGENVQRLMLENVPDKPFAWAAPEPPLLFLAARQFRETVGQLNDGLVQYSELLAELAVAGEMNEEEFNAAAQGINSGLRDAAVALDEEGHEREIAIFSLAATEAFKQYLRSRSKDNLKKALGDNQDNIQAVSDHLRDAMSLAARHTFAEYSPRSFDLALSLAPDSDLSVDKKKDRIVELIELDELLIKRLETLRKLDDSYRSLPAANRELAASLGKDGGGLNSIYRIRDNAKRLRELYKELESPQAGEPAEAESDTETDSHGE